MTRERISVLAGAAVIAAAGLGTGVAIAASSSPGHPAGATASASSAASPGYSWYRSMMSGYYGSGTMMGGSPGGWMMSAAGYQWMTGGGSRPGRVRKGTPPRAPGGPPRPPPEAPA